jgi:hypothetical protein
MAANLVLLSDKPHYCDRCWAITSLDVLKELLFQDGYRLCSRQELIDSASSGCLFCNKLATISLHFQYKQVSLRISPFWTRKEELIAARNVEELFVGGLLHQLRVVFGDHTYALSSTMIWNLDAFTTKGSLKP